MKKALFLALLALLALPVMSQGKKYKKAMKAAVEEMQVAPDVATEMELVPGFEEIALSYPDQWLPSYHASRILVTSSFEESDADDSDVMLDRAKKLLDNAMELVPEESEVHVLESFYYIGLMSVDPMTRGQLYYEDVLAAIQKAKSLNPENPRAYFIDGMMTANLPEFIGGGPEVAKPIFLEAAAKFKTFHNEDPFWPIWGEDLNQAELDRVKE
jgi:hypothetical protein